MPKEYSADGNNTYDQLCINYSNERMQKLFVDLKLSVEKEWYNIEGLNIPFVPFFDNFQTIGMKTP